MQSSTLQLEKDDCIHKGSKRSTCCGTPEIHICRFFKADCLQSVYDKSKLIAQVGTDEASEILVCEICERYQSATLQSQDQK